MSYPIMDLHSSCREHLQTAIHLLSTCLTTPRPRGSLINGAHKSCVSYLSHHHSRPQVGVFDVVNQKLSTER